MNAMKSNYRERNETPLALEMNQVLTIKRAQGTCLQCLRGSVWITLENDPLDFVLSRGEGVCINAPGRIVIEGLEASDMMISRAHPRSRTAQFIARAVASLQGALSVLLSQLVDSHQCPIRTAFEQTTPYHGSFRL